MAGLQSVGMVDIEVALQSRTWRELGVSSEDEQAAKAQFRKRILQKTETWTDKQFLAIGLDAVALQRLRKGYLAWFSLSRLIDVLLQVGINVNIYIPADSIPAGRGKLRIVVGDVEVSAVEISAP